MDNDHLEDAILFIQSCIKSMRDGYGGSEYDLLRAIEELRKESKKRAKIAGFLDRDMDEDVMLDAANEIDKLQDPQAVAVNMMVGSIAKPSLPALLHVHGLYDDFAQVLEIADRNESAPEIVRVRMAMQQPLTKGPSQ